MANDTVSVSTESATTVEEPAGRPEARPPRAPWLAALTWAPIVAAGLAVAALSIATFTGADDDATTTGSGRLGSDQHLVNLAEEVEARARRIDPGSDQHLVNLAEEIEARARRIDPGSDQHLVNLAEEIERRAHLEGTRTTVEEAE